MISAFRRNDSFTDSLESKRSLTGACGLIGLSLLFAACQEVPVVHDLVLENGRVMDPESELDAVKHVGIIDGRIATIADEPLEGNEIVDASGLVVAPGFIDLHAHGQDLESSRFQAGDGVTTALDMELGVFPVANWYESKEGNALINFGAAVGHLPIRIKTKLGLDVGHVLTNLELQDASGIPRNWETDAAAAGEVDAMMGLFETGLREGALGIGIGLEYTPGAGREEVFRIFRFAAEEQAPVFVHTRSKGLIEPGSSVGAAQEVIANAAITGASLHIVHVASSGLAHTGLILEAIDLARQQGIDVTTEMYPYYATSTRIDSAVYSPGWQERLDITYADLLWPATGERLSMETFDQYRREGGLVIGFSTPPDEVDRAISHPVVMIASDGVPFLTGGEHPRGAGTYARVLGVYVRERGTLTLMDALGKMTLMPAQRLQEFVPQMENKGRIKVGADADITVFDADSVADRATYETPMEFSEGIVHVLVNGTFVVHNFEIVEGVLPGQSVRGNRSN